jgi:hypothetical protein
MPFTFAHPAIVLPFKYLPKKWYSLTGLIVGSLIPDFEYFLRMRMQSNYSHTISGLFWFDLPLGILVAFLFHTIARNSFYSNLPLFLKSRILRYNVFDWNTYFKKQWLVVLLSVLVGSITHLFWDSFTHTHGYFVQLFPELNQTLPFFGKKLPVFKLLQHTSTLLGGILLFMALLRIPAESNVKSSLKLTYWILLLLIVLAIVAIRVLNGLSFRAFGHFIATFISAVLISLLLTPIFFKLVSNKKLQ